MNLRSLNLGHNKLSGPIPLELGSVTHLWTLVLQRNQLSGCVHWALRGKVVYFRELRLPYCDY